MADLVSVSDEQRLEVCRELWAYWRRSGCVHLDQAVTRYELEARERLAQKGAKS